MKEERFYGKESFWYVVCKVLLWFIRPHLSPLPIFSKAPSHRNGCSNHPLGIWVYNMQSSQGGLSSRAYSWAQNFCKLTLVGTLLSIKLALYLCQSAFLWCHKHPMYPFEEPRIMLLVSRTWIFSERLSRQDVWFISWLA